MRNPAPVIRFLRSLALRRGRAAHRGVSRRGVSLHFLADPPAESCSLMQFLAVWVAVPDRLALGREHQKPDSTLAKLHDRSYQFSCVRLLPTHCATHPLGWLSSHFFNRSQLQARRPHEETFIQLRPIGSRTTNSIHAGMLGRCISSPVSLAALTASIYLVIECGLALRVFWCLNAV